MSNFVCVVWGEIKVVVSSAIYRFHGRGGNIVVAANLSVFPYRSVWCPVLFQGYVGIHMRSGWFSLRDLPRDLSPILS